MHLHHLQIVFSTKIPESEIEYTETLSMARQTRVQRQFSLTHNNKHESHKRKINTKLCSRTNIPRNDQRAYQHVHPSMVKTNPTSIFMETNYGERIEQKSIWTSTFISRFLANYLTNLHDTKLIMIRVLRPTLSMAWFGKTSKSKTYQSGEQMQIQQLSGP